MTRIEPLRKAHNRYRRGGRGGPDRRVDLAILAVLVIGLFALRRQLSRAATERTGTWVGTVR